MELLNIGHVDCYIAVHFIPDVDGAISISISSFNEIDATNQPIQCIKNAIRMLRILTQQFTCFAVHFLYLSDANVIVLSDICI